MLATLTEEYFSDPGWIYERKLDGVRCLVFKADGKVRILSRNRNSLNKMYPEIHRAVTNMKADNFVADGEIVTFEGNLTSFSRLQKRINVSSPGDELLANVPVFLYLFDLLYHDGENIGEKPLRERKSLLRTSLKFDDPLRYCMHHNEHGEQLLEEACSKGWEGLIAKRADAPYTHSRSSDWLKFKCVNQQELVIAGYTDPKGERVGFGALLVGFYENDSLKYAGKVGTGFSDEELKRLHADMKKRETNESPFDEDVRETGAHWIKPELVAEIGFTEWTGDHKLRHPRYLGLRKDKNASEVVKEAP